MEGREGREGGMMKERRAETKELWLTDRMGRRSGMRFGKEGRGKEGSNERET
jgi:hypothetical protein